MISGRLAAFFMAIRTGDLPHYLAHVRYALWKRWRGLDLGGVGIDALGLDPSRCHYHAESGGPELDAVLKAIDLPRSWNAIDFGSGKGGAMITLAKYFYEVAGVELSPGLVSLCRQNLAAMNLSRYTHRVFCGDATAHLDLARYQVFYFFNPFPGPVMRQVCSNIALSLKLCPRPHALIYKNPAFEKDVLAAGFMPARRFEFKNAHPCQVYELGHATVGTERNET